jgi:hypothetical protein
MTHQRGYIVCCAPAVRAGSSRRAEKGAFAPSLNLLTHNMPMILAIVPYLAGIRHVALRLLRSYMTSSVFHHPTKTLHAMVP